MYFTSIYHWLALEGGKGSKEEVQLYQLSRPYFGSPEGGGYKPMPVWHLQVGRGILQAASSVVALVSCSSCSTRCPTAWVVFSFEIPPPLSIIRVNRITPSSESPGIPVYSFHGWNRCILLESHSPQLSKSHQAHMKLPKARWLQLALLFPIYLTTRSSSASSNPSSVVLPSAQYHPINH